jgi:hypothetical protein
MAFSRTWPKSDGDEVYLDDLNDLLAEFNLRAGTTHDPFEEAVSLGNAIDLLRGYVNDQLQEQSLSGGGITLRNGRFLDTDGAIFVGCDEDPGDTNGFITKNIFEEVFGSGRRAWLNDASTEATAQGAWPYFWPCLKCGDSTAWTLLLNELYSVISYLTWHWEPATDAAGSCKAEDWPGEWAAAKQDALDAAAAWLAAASATASGAANGPQGGVIAHSMSGETPYYADPQFHDWFLECAIPSTATAAKIWFYGLLNNYYRTDVPDYAAPDAWNLKVYGGTTDPDTLNHDERWTYGALAASPAAPNVETHDDSYYISAYGDDLTVSAGETNWFRLQAPERDSADNWAFLAAHGEWYNVFSSLYYQVPIAGLGNALIRIAVKRF